jgi:hypothetical protein
MAEQDAASLVTVRLVGLPVEVHARTAEHSDELMREFTYLRAQSSDPDGGDVPTRLLELVEEIRVRFTGFTSASQAELEDAIARGLEEIDLEYQVPASVAEACIQLRDLLDEADRFCLAGDHLLTLATPPDAVAYRNWFLDEFVRQSAGGEPRRWPPG